jgi:hypothetical protein
MPYALTSNIFVDDGDVKQIVSITIHHLQLAAGAAVDTTAWATVKKCSGDASGILAHLLPRPVVFDVACYEKYATVRLDVSECFPVPGTYELECVIRQTSHERVFRQTSTTTFEVVDPTTFEVVDLDRNGEPLEPRTQGNLKFDFTDSQRESLSLIIAKGKEAFEK